MASARPKSAAIISGRRRRRSIQTPAGSEKTTNGSTAKARRSETPSAPAFRTKSAASGSARIETCVPTWLIPFAAHSMTKPLSRQRSLRGLRRFGPERCGRRLEEAAGGVGLGRRRRRHGLGHLLDRADGGEEHRQEREEPADRSDAKCRAQAV